MEGTRSRKRHNTALKDEEDGSASDETAKRKAVMQENTSPVAKRTRFKKACTSDSGPEDDKAKNDVIIELMEENKKLAAEVEATKANLSKTKEENQRNLKLEEELNEAHGKIEAVMTDAHNKIVNLEKELYAAQQELDNVASIRAENTQHHLIQDELNNACVKIDQLKAENVSLCEDLEKLRKENHVGERMGLMKALTHACAELDKARLQIADMETTKAADRLEVANSPHSVSKETEEEINALKEEIKKLQFENAQRNGLYTALTHSCAELDRCREENAKLSSQITSLKKSGYQNGADDPLDLSNKSHTQTTSTEVQEYLDEINRLRTEIVHLRAAPPMMVTVAATPSAVSSSDYPGHAEVTRLQQEIAELKDYRDEAEKMKSEIHELQGENQKMAGLQVALSHACTEVDKLRDQVSQEKTFSSAMCVQINRQRELERDLTEAKGQLDELRMESSLRQSLEKKLQEAFAEIDKLRADKAERNRPEVDLIAVNTKVDKLQTDLMQAKNSVVLKDGKETSED